METPSQTLVILPGLDGTEVMFRSSVALLPASVRPVVVTYPPAAADTYAGLFALVRERVAGLTDFFLLGSSFSGPLAIMLAAAEPARVRGLILSATFLRAPRTYQPWLRFAAVTPLVWAVRTTRRLPVWLGRRSDDPFRRAKAEIWRRVPARCLAGRMRAILGVDVRAELGRCEQPILCLTFANDRVVPRPCAEEILARRPAAELVTLPGEHLGMAHDPASWTREIARFLRERG